MGYRLGGKQYRKSTGERDEQKAKAILDGVETMIRHRSQAAVLDGVYQALTGKVLPNIALRLSMENWLNECKAAGAAGTYERYSHLGRQFLEYLKATEKTPLLRDVSNRDVRDFLVAQRSTLAAGSVNLSRKILSIFFNQAIVAGYLDSNPVKGTKLFKSAKADRVDRRAFTTTEIQSMLGKAPDEFWGYMITAGFYTGLRMGDLICLRWIEVDLDSKTINLVSGKTDEDMHIPIASPLFAILLRLRKAADAKSEFIWPEQAALYRKQGAGPFSNEFYEQILTPCGLVVPRTNKKAKQGRAVKRQLNSVSFHSFRHTFISFLKTSGASQSVAKELAGHSSDAVNDLYTHTSPEVLEKAINLLPELAQK